MFLDEARIPKLFTKVARLEIMRFFIKIMLRLLFYLVSGATLFAKNILNKIIRVVKTPTLDELLSDKLKNFSFQ